MEKPGKKQVLLQKIEAFGAMRCPVCFEALAVKDETLMCQKGHSFDVNKKGYAFLCPKKVETHYDQALFEARANVFRAGFYEPVMAAVKEALGDAKRVLDAGCGEGYYLEKMNVPFGVGVDISPAAIQMAARERAGQIWCVADLAALPFQDGAFDAVIDVLSPANYSAFFRVLKLGGRLIKVFPRGGYLKEIRERMGQAPYEAGKVLDHLKAHTNTLRVAEIMKTAEIDPQLWRSFVHMTPLTGGLDPTEKEALCQNPSETITIDLGMAVACG